MRLFIFLDVLYSSCTLTLCNGIGVPFDMVMMWVDVFFSVGAIGGPSAYGREGPTPRRAPKGEGPTSRRAPEGEGHYQFCNLSRLLIAICTLR